MDSSIRTGTPLRQRMIDDMRMRKLEDKTQEAYIRAVRKLAAFLRRSPDAATVEDLRRFQLHLVDQGTSPITLNATLTGSAVRTLSIPCSLCTCTSVVALSISLATRVVYRARTRLLRICSMCLSSMARSRRSKDIPVHVPYGSRGAAGAISPSTTPWPMLSYRAFSFLGVRSMP